MFRNTGTTVPKEFIDMLDEDINATEIWNIIKASSKGKSPGNDGLTNEFYKFFWLELEPHLLKVYKNCIERGILTTSLRRKQAFLA